MYDEAMVAMARLLVFRKRVAVQPLNTTSSPRTSSDASLKDLVYLAEWTGSTVLHRMEHLACFAGAMLAYGAQDGGQFDREHLALAISLGETCYAMYTHTPTALAPEAISFIGPPYTMRCPRASCANALRPEALETFYVLYHYTRDPRWREMGWHVFEAFERHSTAGVGWAGVEDVMSAPLRSGLRGRDGAWAGRVRQVDRMESFVLAETFKYPTQPSPQS